MGQPVICHSLLSSSSPFSLESVGYTQNKENTVSAPLRLPSREASRWLLMFEVQMQNGLLLASLASNGSDIAIDKKKMVIPMLYGPRRKRCRRRAKHCKFGEGVNVVSSSSSGWPNAQSTLTCAVARPEGDETLETGFMLLHSSATRLNNNSSCIRGRLTTHFSTSTVLT